MSFRDDGGSLNCTFLARLLDLLLNTPCLRSFSWQCLWLSMSAGILFSLFRHLHFLSLILVTICLLIVDLYIIWVKSGYYRCVVSKDRSVCRRMPSHLLCYVELKVILSFANDAVVYRCCWV